MHRNLLFTSLLALLGLTLPLPHATAQQADEGNLIRLQLTSLPTNDDEDPIPLTLAIEGTGEISIEGVQETYSPDQTAYTPTELEIVIHGDVTSLECNYCSVLDLVDVTGCSTIQTLDIENSPVTNLMATHLPTLSTLVCGRTSISALDLTGCTALQTLYSGSCMKLKSVTLQDCTALEEIELQNCEITELDLSGMTNLKSLIVQRNPITLLGLSGLSKLAMLECNETQIATLDLTDCVALENLSASGCTELATISMPATSKLQYIYLQGCQLQEIDLSNFTELKEASLERNNLSKVTLVNCPNLKTLSVHLNALTAETTLALVQGLPDHGAEWDDIEPAFKLFARGIRYEYEEANEWSPKAASIARRKGWMLLEKNEDSYDIPMPIFSYAQVTLQQSANGRIALEGFDSEDLSYLPQGKSYKVIATPDEGYELTALVLNDEEDILADQEFKLFEDSKIVATFTAQGDPNAYEYYLTKVESSVANPLLNTYTYGYDDNKRWIARTERTPQGDLSTHQYLHYNEQGLISGIDFTTAFDQDGTPSMFTYYTYDAEGRMTRRQMTFVTPMADYEIVYRTDGQKDYWVDAMAGVMNLYIYNDKGQLIEEQFGEVTDLDKERPSISYVSGKTFYSYDNNGRLSLIKYANSTSGFLYMKGEEYQWDDKGYLSAIKALNYQYEKGETDPEKGEPMSVFEFRYKYDDKANTKVFWPKLPFTELNGELYEFSYHLKGYCHMAEYWSLSAGDESHPLDLVYTFEASPQHLQELVTVGQTSVQYQDGIITAEGAALEALQIYDTTGQLLRDYSTEPCQRISMGVRELPEGLYIVRTISTDSVQTDKVIIAE